MAITVDRGSFAEIDLQKLPRASKEAERVVDPEPDKLGYAGVVANLRARNPSLAKPKLP